MLPSLIEFDTLYYFGFDNSEDDSSYKGSISTLDIFLDKLIIESLSADQHKFVIDIGKKKYEFVCSTWFIAE